MQSHTQEQVTWDTGETAGDGEVTPGADEGGTEAKSLVKGHARSPLSMHFEKETEEPCRAPCLRSMR